MAQANARITLRGVRLSFSQRLWEPDYFRGDSNTNLRYGANCIWTEDQTQRVDAKLAEQVPSLQAGAVVRLTDIVKAAMKHVRTLQWPKNPPKISSDRMCLHNGAEKADTPGYGEGTWFIGANRNATDGRPDIRDRKARPLSDQDRIQGRGPYDGCYVNFVVDVWAQADYGNRINATLVGVQFVRDGEPFGGSPPAKDDDFDVMEDDDDGEDWGTEAATVEGAGDDDFEEDDLLA